MSKREHGFRLWHHKKYCVQGVYDGCNCGALQITNSWFENRFSVWVASRVQASLDSEEFAVKYGDRPGADALYDFAAEIHGGG